MRWAKCHLESGEIANRRGSSRPVRLLLFPVPSVSAAVLAVSALVVLCVLLLPLDCSFMMRKFCADEVPAHVLHKELFFINYGIFFRPKQANLTKYPHITAKSDSQIPMVSRFVVVVCKLFLILRIATLANHHSLLSPQKSGIDIGSMLMIDYDQSGCLRFV